MNEAIKNATEKFAQLLEKQLARVEMMKTQKDFLDYDKLDTIIIGVCGGDGIGPAITASAPLLTAAISISWFPTGESISQKFFINQNPKPKILSLL